MDKAAEGGIVPLEIAIANDHKPIVELLRPGILEALEALLERAGDDKQLLSEHLARSGDDSQLSAEHAAALAPLRACRAERNAGKI